MANTMKFGNGQWATKKDSILAYNDENANFKPLPFVTSRASTATRVNKLGLIETVASGIPRVDYLGNTKGAYLLEPQSTNLIAQSEAFSNSYWTKSGASVEGDASTAGSEQVVNGNFASSASWTANANAAISGGVATFVTGTASLQQSIGVTIGSNYKLTYTINSGTGTFNLSSGGFTASMVIPSSVGTHTVYLNAENTNDLYFVCVGSANLVIDNVSVKEVSGFSAPSADTPLGAFKLVEDTSTGSHSVYESSTSVSAGKVTHSVIAKSNGRRYLGIVDLVLDKGYYFDLDNGVIADSFVLGAADSYDIQSISSDWYRISITVTATGTQSWMKILLSNDGVNESYTGNGTSGVYLFGAQLEQKYYATSYIKTSGSQITRLSDTASQTVPSNIFNSVEGVIYTEISSLSNDGTQRRFTFGDANFSNNIRFTYLTTDNLFEVNLYNGSDQGKLSFTLTNAVELNKIAYLYSPNNFQLWVNGVKVDFVNSGTTFSSGTLVKIAQGDSNGQRKFYGKTNDLRVYNTVLTDAELAKLTKI